MMEDAHGQNTPDEETTPMVNAITPEAQPVDGDTQPGRAHLVTVITPHRPGWKTTEFWLSLVAIVIGALLAAGVVDKYDGWQRVLGAALSVLTALGYGAGRAKVKAASKTLPPLIVLSLIVLSSGCATWMDTTVKGLATASALNDEASRVVERVCRPVLAECIKARQNPCPALLSCQARRHDVLRVMATVQQGVLLGLVGVRRGNMDSALIAVGTALDGARRVCAALRTWGVEPELCSAIRSRR